MKQCKNMALVLYEEPALNLIEFLHPKKWAYILHNNDVMEDGSLKKEHWHLLMSFESKKSLSAVANCFGMEENLIEVVRNYKGMERYLCHLDNPEKFQYNLEDVVSNYDYCTEVNKTPESMLQLLIDECQVFDNIRDYNLWVMSLGSDYMALYKKYYSMIKDVIYFQQRNESAIKRENRQNNSLVSNMCNDELLDYYKAIVLNDSHEPFDELIIRECIKRNLIACRGLRIDENFDNNSTYEMGGVAYESDKE